jgi:hypothetical protein
LIFTPFITAPIESFLQLVQRELAVGIADGCLENIGDSQPQFVATYTVRAYAGSQFYQAATTANAIAIQYLGTLGSEYSSGANTKKHQIKLISAGGNMDEVICNRDYAVMAIEWGLKVGELKFPLSHWSGIYARLGNPAAQFTDNNHIWIATSSLMIGLDKDGCS